MKYVLFIVNYFPPMGGSGVQRPLKFVKYLRVWGWEPVILAPEPGMYHTFDLSLMEELEQMNVAVHRVPAKTLFHLAGGNPKHISEPPAAISKFLRKISNMLFMPDNKKNWINPGLVKARELVEQYPIEVIFATAPAYSNLLLAVKLKNETRIPVVLDLRDDWSESHLIDYVSRWHKTKMRQMEDQTLDFADAITVVNAGLKTKFEERGNSSRNVVVINQGFDPEDFNTDKPQDCADTEKTLNMWYGGKFYGDRKPDFFLRVFSNWVQSKNLSPAQIKLHFQGGLERYVFKLASELNIRDFIIDHGVVPHKQAVSNIYCADVLWLVIGHTTNSERVTLGKMFEYFGTAKPILGLIPDGESARLLAEYKAAFLASPYVFDEILKQLDRIYYLWSTNSLPTPDRKFIERYDRRQSAGRLAELFNQISS